MNLNSLIKLTGRDKKRVGRGIGSGKGKTAGRGTKGQNSRSGGGVKVGFEGGQMKITQRIPKLKGFKKFNQIKFQPVNISSLNIFSGKVTKKDMHEKGIILDPLKPVKILANGKIEKALEIDADAVSATAKVQIEKAGGKINLPKEK